MTSMETAAGRILFVTRGYPYPTRDGALQYTSQLIDAFAANAGQVDVLCAAPLDKGSNKPAKPESELGNVTFHFFPRRSVPILDRIFTWKPNSSLSFRTVQSAETLRDRLKARPDVVVIDHVGASWAADEVPAELPLIYLTHNNELLARLSIVRYAPNPLRGIPSLVDAVRLYFHDRSLTRRARAVSVISKRDRATHAKIYGNRDYSYIPPTYASEIGPPRRIDQTTPRQVCIVGSFEWQAKRNNLLSFLAANAEPLRSAEIELVIAGRSDPGFLAMVRARYPWVRMEGEVETVAPILNQSRIGILQGLAGGGFRLTTLTYIFGGCPILSRSELVADLDLQPDRDYLRCETETSFHRLATEVIDDVERLDRMQQNALETCQGFADPGRMRAAARALLEKCL